MTNRKSFKRRNWSSSWLSSGSGRPPTYEENVEKVERQSDLKEFYWNSGVERMTGNRDIRGPVTI